MSEEKKKLEKNDLHQIISNIIEVTMLTMYHADDLAEQYLVTVTYSPGSLIYSIDSYKVYTYIGTISQTKDRKCFSFVANIENREETVGQIHISSLDGSKNMYGVEISIGRELHIYNFKLVNGQMELINSNEVVQKYEDGSIVAENNKNNQAFTK